MDTTFWLRFLEFCDMRGKKSTTVAAEMGFRASTVQMWRKGSIPNADALIKISKYFRCSIEYLLGVFDADEERFIRNMINLDNDARNKVIDYLYELEAEESNSVNRNKALFGADELIKLYRNASKGCKDTILDTAKAIAAHDPEKSNDSSY